MADYIDPSGGTATIDELFAAAVRFHQSGQLPEAEALYRQVLEAHPSHADAVHLLGILAHQTGHHQAAISLIRQAIALNPTAALFHFNLGTVHQAQAQLAEAIASYRQALCFDPTHVRALINMGNALKNQGQRAEAAQSYRQAIRIDPNQADAHYNLGLTLAEQGAVAEAMQCFQQTLAINPNHAKAPNDLGNAFQKQGRFVEAAQCYRQALRSDPNHADLHYNLGLALVEQGELVDGILCYRQALQINPNHASAVNNLGNALRHQGQLAQAEACFRRALEIDDGLRTALWNRSFMRLLNGDFEGGWQDYEQRWAQAGVLPRTFSQPRWDGSSLEGKTILVYAEQGLGDTLQFIRYASLVKQRGGTVLFECQPSLHRLLRGVAGIDQLVAQGATLPPFDVQSALLSLPGVFGTTPATIPAGIPYLAADSKLVELWGRELGRERAFHVGICWQGNADHPADRYRSFPATHFESVARIEGVRLVSLQKGSGTNQLQELIGRIDNPSHILDVSGRLDTEAAFVDTAALMMNLDLVVTGDTAVAHLAGALGVPVWVLLPIAPDWRWLLERADNPWYPTMRLFRQTRFGDWAEVFERVAEEIRLKAL
jgi:tetratricopeptide (TPR) repeat protein